MEISANARVERAEPAHAEARPERSAPAYPLWIRVPLATMWCFVVEIGASYVTACRSRIAVGEDVDPSAEPPRAKRCPVCERHRIVASEIARVERGLVELAANATIEGARW